MLGSAADAEDVLQETLVAAWRSGIDDRALRAALQLIASRADDRAREVRASIHAELSAAYMLDRRLAEALEDGALAQSIAVEDFDRAMRCNLDATMGSVLLFSGRMDEGWRMLEDAIERARDRRFEGPAARAYRMIGSSASVLVEYDRAERWLREGIEYAERVERFNDRHYMTAHLGHVRWATGDWDGALTEARHALVDGRGGITTRITALLGDLQDKADAAGRTAAIAAERFHRAKLAEDTARDRHRSLAAQADAAASTARTSRMRAGLLAASVARGGGKPGAAGPISGWEYRFAAATDVKKGDYDAAYETTAAGLAEHPDDPNIHYDLACHAAMGSSPSAREQRRIASHRRSTASSSLSPGKTLRAHILPGTAATHH